jgi:hypothetical protein
MSADDTMIRSLDYDALCRRFDCFIAPGENDGELETGIDRLTQIHPPYNPAGLDAINNGMLESASDRKKLKNVWKDAVVENTRPVAEVIVPKRAKLPVFTAKNVFLILLAIAAMIFGVLYTPVSVVLLFYTFTDPDMFFMTVLMALIVISCILFGVYTILYMLPWFINHLTPRMSVRSLCNALLRALKEQGEINKKARFIIETTFDRRGFRIYLDDCTAREQTVFQKSVCEMFSPIHAPDFIMIRAGMFHSLRWKWSFTCPSVIGRSDVFVKIFEKHLRLSLGLMKFQFTHRDPGRKYLIIARNKSYINYRNIHVEKRLHVLKRDRF